MSKSIAPEFLILETPEAFLANNQQAREMAAKEGRKEWVKEQLGIARLRSIFEKEPPLPPILANLSRRVVEELEFLSTRRDSEQAVMAEMDGMLESHRQVQAARGLGDLPLVVLAAGRSEPPPGEAEAVWRERHRILLEEQQPRLARLSSRGKLVRVPQSGHVIQFEAPRIVIDAIKEVERQPVTAGR